jgi:tight adherence protein B
MDSIFLASLIVSASILCIFVGISFIISGHKLTLKERLDTYSDFPVLQKNIEQKDASGKSQTKPVTGIGLSQQLAGELARAGLPLKVSEYVFIQVLFAGLGFILGYVIFSANGILAFLFAVLGFFSPALYVRYSQSKRQSVFGEQLGDALVLLSNALRSGYGLAQAIEAVSKELAPPISDEFGRIVREFSLGVSIDVALANLLRRNPSVDLEIVVTAINVQHEVGGNLAEILDTIAFTIRDRMRIAADIRSLTAQQRFSATVLLLLPFVVGLVVYAMNPTYMSLLWQNTCGIAMLITALVLMLIGYLLIQRIIAVNF